jgi:TetR/AcrR family transcriptional repressor of nem operon
MRYPKEETAKKHEAILIEAGRLFRENGFHGVSVSEIMKASGLTHGPFYNHFSSKDALIAESIRSLSSTALEEMDVGASTPAAMIDYVQDYLSVEHRDAPETGCLMTALAGEVRNEPAARPAFSIHLRSVIGKLTDYFPWKTKRHARRDSVRMISAMVGAIVLARAVEDEALSLEILDHVKSAYQ